MIGILGCVFAAVAVAVTAVSTAVSIGMQYQAKEAQEDVNRKSEYLEKKKEAMQSSIQNSQAIRTRQAAASGIWLSMFETQRLKRKTDALNHKVSEVNDNRPKPKVSRSTYSYGNVHA